MTASGWFQADMGLFAMAMTARFPIHNQNVNGRLLPKIDVDNFYVAFDTTKMGITLSGGILPDIGNLFIGMFKNTIIKMIEAIINAQVPGMIAGAI